MAKKHRQSESGRHRNERRAHDRAVRAHTTTDMGRPWHASPAIRVAFIVIAAVVILSITILFMSGLIRW